MDSSHFQGSPIFFVRNMALEPLAQKPPEGIVMPLPESNMIRDNLPPDLARRIPPGAISARRRTFLGVQKENVEAGKEIRKKEKENE